MRISGKRSIRGLILNQGKISYPDLYKKLVIGEVYYGE